MPRSKAAVMAENIIRANDGKVLYNLGEVSKLTGYGVNTVPKLLHEHGVLVKKDGKSKKVNIYDLVDFMLSGRVAPID